MQNINFVSIRIIYLMSKQNDGSLFHNSRFQNIQNYSNGFTVIHFNLYPKLRTIFQPVPIRLNRSQSVFTVRLAQVIITCSSCSGQLKSYFSYLSLFMTQVTLNFCDFGFKKAVTQNLIALP